MGVNLCSELRSNCSDLYSNKISRFHPRHQEEESEDFNIWEGLQHININSPSASSSKPESSVSPNASDAQSPELSPNNTKVQELSRNWKLCQAVKTGGNCNTDNGSHKLNCLTDSQYGECSFQNTIERRRKPDESIVNSCSAIGIIPEISPRVSESLSSETPEKGHFLMPKYHGRPSTATVQIVYSSDGAGSTVGELEFGPTCASGDEVGNDLPFIQSSKGDSYGAVSPQCFDEQLIQVHDGALLSDLEIEDRHSGKWQLSDVNSDARYSTNSKMSPRSSHNSTSSYPRTALKIIDPKCNHLQMQSYQRKEIRTLPESTELETFQSVKISVSKSHDKETTDYSKKQMEELSNISQIMERSQDNGVSQTEVADSASEGKKAKNLLVNSSENKELIVSYRDVPSEKLLMAGYSDVNQQKDVQHISLCPKSEDENKWETPRTSHVEEEIFLQQSPLEHKDAWVNEGNMALPGRRTESYSGSSVASASSSKSARRVWVRSSPACLIDLNLMAMRKKIKFEDFDSHTIPAALKTIRQVLLDDQQLSILFENDPSITGVFTTKWERWGGGYTTTVKFTKDMNKKVFGMKIKSVVVTKELKITTDENKLRIWDRTTQAGVKYSDFLVCHYISTFRCQEDPELTGSTMHVEFGLQFLKKPIFPRIKRTMKREAKKQFRKWNDLMATELATRCQVLAQPNLFD